MHVGSLALVSCSRFHAFVFPLFARQQRNSYLELSNWNLKEAIQSAKEDRDWEEMDSCSLKSGEIRIKMTMKGGVPVSYSAQGAGIQPKTKPAASTEKKDETEKTAKKSETTTTKVTPVKDIPAIASKTVKASDVYKAAAQHDNCGFELKVINPKKEG